MTTKFKIILGFAVLIVLLGVMAFFGYSSLQTASGNFDNYRRLANVNVNSSDMKSAVYETMYYARNYLQERTPELAKEATARADRAIAMVDAAASGSRLEETLKSLQEARVLLTAITTDIGALQGSIEKVLTIFTQEYRPNMKTMIEYAQGTDEGSRERAKLEAPYSQTPL